MRWEGVGGGSQRGLLGPPLPASLGSAFRCGPSRIKRVWRTWRERPPAPVGDLSSSFCPKAPPPPRRPRARPAPLRPSVSARCPAGPALRPLLRADGALLPGRQTPFPFPMPTCWERPEIHSQELCELMSTLWSVLSILTNTARWSDGQFHRET